MAENRYLSLVVGYHEVTPAPTLAVEERLAHRFGVVLDHDFDADLFASVILGVSAIVRFDEFCADCWGGARCDSTEEMIEQVMATHEHRPMPPLRMLYRNAGRLVCLEETEFWAYAGGPQPYSDSYTLSFYTAEDLAEDLLAACFTACRERGAILYEVIRASPVPVDIPWWRCLLDKLR